MTEPGRTLQLHPPRFKRKDEVYKADKGYRRPVPVEDQSIERGVRVMLWPFFAAAPEVHVVSRTLESALLRRCHRIARSPCYMSIFRVG